MKLGFVYFVLDSANSRMKIGYSRNPTARLSQLNTEFGGLKMIGACEGSKATEKQFHRTFAHLLVYRHEWFEATPELLAVAEAFSSGLNLFQKIRKHDADGIPSLSDLQRSAAILLSAMRAQKKFGQYIDEYLTLADPGEGIVLAGQIDVSPQYLCDVRRGRRTIQTHVLRRLANMGPSPAFLERIVDLDKKVTK